MLKLKYISLCEKCFYYVLMNNNKVWNSYGRMSSRSLYLNECKFELHNSCYPITLLSPSQNFLLFFHFPIRLFKPLKYYLKVSLLTNRYFTRAYPHYLHCLLHFIITFLHLFYLFYLRHFVLKFSRLISFLLHLHFRHYSLSSRLLQP